MEIRNREMQYKGRKVRVTAIMDVTGRKRVEETLRESEARYKSLYQMIRLMCDNVPDLIWAKDLEKRFIFANKAICNRLLNAKDSKEAIGKTDMYFAERERSLHRDQPDWHNFGEICADSDLVVLSSRRPERFIEFGNALGQFLYLDVHKAPFLDENGNMIGTVGCGREVTREKQLEEQQKRTEEEIKRRTADMSLLNALNAAANRGEGLQKIISLLSEQTKRIFSSTGATVYLSSEDKQYDLAESFDLRKTGALDREFD